jgi:hypothetical protein
MKVLKGIYIYKTEMAFFFDTDEFIVIFNDRPSKFFNQKSTFLFLN